MSSRVFQCLFNAWFGVRYDMTFRDITHILIVVHLFVPKQLVCSFCNWFVHSVNCDQGKQMNDRIYSTQKRKAEDVGDKAVILRFITHQNIMKLEIFYMNLQMTIYLSYFSTASCCLHHLIG